MIHINDDNRDILRYMGSANKNKLTSDDHTALLSCQ